MSQQKSQFTIMFKSKSHQRENTLAVCNKVSSIFFLHSSYISSDLLSVLRSAFRCCLQSLIIILSRQKRQPILG